jgi:type II secretory pathway predicted ATPase ExeA
MKGMTGDETASYIRHHLEAAGRTADLFTVRCPEASGQSIQ